MPNTKQEKKKYTKKDLVRAKMLAWDPPPSIQKDGASVPVFGGFAKFNNKEVNVRGR